MKRCMLLAFLCFFSLGTIPVAFPDVPDIKKDCSICHEVHEGVPGRLLRTLPELCTECHPDRTGSGEHPIGIKLPKTMPNGLLLDKQKEITCMTCHAPHGEGGFPKMLRKRGAELCSACHK